MSDRFSNLGDLKHQASERGIELSDSDIRWAELAIFKRAYQINARDGHPSKMLMRSMRVNPQVDDGTAASWHIEKIAGGDVVYTCPPPYLEQIMQVQDRFRPFDPKAIHEPPPKAAMDKLLRIPNFIQAYEPEGMVLEQFNRFAPLIATMAEFSAAMRKTVDFVASSFRSSGDSIIPKMTFPSRHCGRLDGERSFDRRSETLPEKSQRMLLARNIHS
ncbi:MAG: hypothetical protein ACYS30_22600 [Planctomycetota bacterium]